MLGTYRYFLAAMVALAHLWPGRLPWVGIYAVFSFYLLSGYLMTRVLSETYGFSAGGVARFLANRALRIYPPYFAALLLALVVWRCLPNAVSQVIPSYDVRASPGEVVKNLVLLGLTNETRVKWIPPAWTLHVELAFYLGMPLLLARTRGATLGWLVVSLAYLATVLARDASAMSMPQRYFPLLAASLPFSVGSLLYRGRHLLPRFFGPGAAAIAAMAFGANLLFARLLWTDVFLGGFYASLVLSTLASATLAGVRRSDCPGWLRRLDDVLGDVTYPLFLCHYHVAVVVWWLLPVCRQPRALFFALSLVCATATSWLIHVGVEKPVARLRDALRARPRRMA